MALLTVTDAGDSLVWVDCDAGSDGYDEFPNDGRTMVQVQNGSGVVRTFTAKAQDPVNCPAEKLHDTVVSMNAGDYGALEPAGLSMMRFNTAAGRTRIEYSDETDMKVSVHRVL